MIIIKHLHTTETYEMSIGSVKDVSAGSYVTSDRSAVTTEEQPAMKTSSSSSSIRGLFDGVLNGFGDITVAIAAGVNDDVPGV